MNDKISKKLDDNVVLAYDFGASSGRAIIGIFRDSKIYLKEIHRFENNPVTLNKILYWDVLRLIFEIKTGILKAKKDFNFSSIAFDTWGVDFALIDKNNNLINNPVHYRDSRTNNIISKVEKNIIPIDKLYDITGIQIMPINTLFQLYSIIESDHNYLNNVSTLLLMPDFFSYLFTGKKVAEYSIASTTQFIDYQNKTWNKSIINKFKIPNHIFPKVINSGKILGKITKEICNELEINKNIEIISITGHDTACAVVAVPAFENDYIYLSCGTWSLLGTEIDKPIINEKSKNYNLTNEYGYNNKIRFLKNITGLWLINETKRYYSLNNKNYSFDEITKLANESPAFNCFIDPDNVEFSKPGNIPKKIIEFCKKTNQNIPKNDGEIFRCIYESLAFKYKMAYDQIKECTGKIYNTIHIIGGGSQSEILCQMTASAVGLNAYSGPIEATSIGNIVMQLIAKKQIENIKQAREIVFKSFNIKKYNPQDQDKWIKYYNLFIEIIK